MASFVTEVLASSGKLEKDDLSCKISKLSQKVEETKSTGIVKWEVLYMVFQCCFPPQDEVCDMINKRYSEFLPSLQRAEELMAQVAEVSKDIEMLKSCIANEVSVMWPYSSVKPYDLAMEEYHRALQEKKYTVAAEQLEKTRSCVDSLKAWKGCELQLLRALSSEHTVQRENLIYHLGDEWKKLVVWKLPTSKELSAAESFLKTELRLCSGMQAGDGSDPPSLLASVLQALAIQGQLNHKIKLFGQVLLKYMLKPLISYPSLHVEVGEQPGQGAVLTLQLEETSAEHTSPSQVYTRLLAVLRVLHAHMFDVTVGEKKVSIVLGDMIWEEMSDCIIRECLLYSIPSNSSQLSKYSMVIKETEEFEKTLKELKYLTMDSTDLLQYARNVNSHFASKKCQDVIVAARNLMTSEIHNTVKISPESKLSLPRLPSLDSKDNAKQEADRKRPPSADTPALENEKQLGQRTLCLPVCRISESVQQLMELTLATLSETVGSSSQCAIQLFYTVRNIFQLFYDVVPTYHKENLLKFPHLAAIHHNNCMFIAHHLLTLGHQFRPHLPQPLSDGAATFVDLVPSFRRLGTECFLAQMNAQKAEMLERLSTARNFANLDDEENYSAASKAVRQVSDTSVLPDHERTLLSEFTKRVTDISTEDGDHLHTLCQTIIDEGPLVFLPLPDENKNRKYQEEVPIYVKKWMSFKELAIVLQANLQEIVDRWADGKGPLALEFTSNEVKNLIRALFQNTERRAVALTKIK
ncbi:centromere/kinetochore protein zw10-like [Scleropages formosus]|uniref:Centromere/kinetochore protein zw10-like n=1 Tax=Scleropages formosus TaxID=113540 RepID=A0A0P7XAY2_SCLFO|nr:centromere/kinetochore protein zw10-like [Scleropages formosus]